MKEVSYKGDSNFKLFAVFRCLVDGWKLSRDADHVLMSKCVIKIKFGIVIWTTKGTSFCCMMKRGGTTLKITAAATKGGKQMSLAKAHHLLGYTHHRMTVKTAKYLGWGKLEDSGKECQLCTEEK